jgi:dTDP-4-dehydrorhamnose reductase
MVTILVLGHKGMLGNATYSYFSSLGEYEVKTIEERWGSPLFENAIAVANPDIIVNCIGAIPQKKPTDAEYMSTNVGLPAFLEKLGRKIVHPSTDCEFSGNLPVGEQYTKESLRDADDTYGKSKADASQLIEDSFVNTKIIRTSIIGHELASSVALLDWFLNSEVSVKGYTDHYWNGITTLEWARCCRHLIENWSASPRLNQYSSGPNLSKYEVLELAKEVYEKNIDIIPHTTGTPINKCLLSDKALPSLKEQLQELRNFYRK